MGIYHATCGRSQFGSKQPSRGECLRGSPAPVASWSTPRSSSLTSPYGWESPSSPSSSSERGDGPRLPMASPIPQLPSCGGGPSASGCSTSSPATCRWTSCGGERVPLGAVPGHRDDCGSHPRVPDLRDNDREVHRAEPGVLPAQPAQRDPGVQGVLTAPPARRDPGVPPHDLESHP
jgi:hypothetical protein